MSEPAERLASEAAPVVRVLVVEDERAQREALARYLQGRGYLVDAVDTAEEALQFLQERPYAAMLTDLRLPGMDGLGLISRAHEIDPGLGTLLVTAYASVESAVEALRRSAHDYLLKPLILEEVGRKIDRLLEHRKLREENALLRRALQTQADPSETLVAVSPPMKKVREWVARAAGTRANVLLTGETGTGKEVVARAIHRAGGSSPQPFLAVNLAAVPETMVESELFGHERGAFTGADSRREGLLRAAGRGTVFLDEIAELPAALQAKLLRALEAREVKPLGCDSPVPFEARIIAATHRELEARVETGTFREDLYYRLNVIRIHIPPLRERPEDVPALIRHLMDKIHGQRLSISPEAVRILCSYPWSGNVRELRNVLERAAILAEDGSIDPAHLPTDLRESVEEPGLGLQDAVERFEGRHIALVLRLCDGNRERAAEELGISTATLYRRLEKYGLKGAGRTSDESRST